MGEGVNECLKLCNVIYERTLSPKVRPHKILLCFDKSVVFHSTSDSIAFLFTLFETLQIENVVLVVIVPPSLFSSNYDNE
jgi:hypothetical protein